MERGHGMIWSANSEGQTAAPEKCKLSFTALTQARIIKGGGGTAALQHQNTKLLSTLGLK